MCITIPETTYAAEIAKVYEAKESIIHELLKTALSKLELLIPETDNVDSFLDFLSETHQALAEAGGELWT